MLDGREGGRSAAFVRPNASDRWFEVAIDGDRGRGRPQRTARVWKGGDAVSSMLRPREEACRSRPRSDPAGGAPSERPTRIRRRRRGARGRTPTDATPVDGRRAAAQRRAATRARSKAAGEPCAERASARASYGALSLTPRPMSCQAAPRHARVDRLCFVLVTAARSRPPRASAPGRPGVAEQADEDLLVVLARLRASQRIWPGVSDSLSGVPVVLSDP